MSYILDALKKSEQDRNRREVPDWQTTHSTEEPVQKQQRLIILIVSGLVSIIVIGAGIWWWQQKAPATPVEAQKTVRNKTTFTDFKGNYDKAITSNPTPTASMSDKKTNATKITSTKSKPSSQQSSVIFATEHLDEGLPPLSSANNNTSEKASVANPESINIVNISQVPNEIRKSIPTISFSGHVYSGSPKQRSIMINGRKMQEGTEVSADFTVHEITTSGAVFYYKEWYFRLSALQDWSYDGQ